LIQLSVFGFLTVLLSCFNACTPFEANFASSSNERMLVSESAFEKTLYPELQTNCGQYHGAIQQPLFSNPEKAEAHSVILRRGLVDFNNPSSSYFLLKLSSGHNSFPTEVIDSLRSKIQAWVQAVNDYDATLPTPIPVEPGIQFQPADASSVLSKLKYFAHGGALTEAEWLEHSESIQNKNKLKALLDTWMATPEGYAKMQFYLTNALNQDINLGEDSLDVFGINNNTNFQRSLRDSFARTAMDIIDRNQPFTNINTTRRYAVNSALLAGYAFMERATGNNNGLRDLLGQNAIASDYTDWRFITFQESNNISATAFTDLAHWRGLSNNSNVSFAIPRVGYFSTLAFQGNYPSNVDNQFRVITNQTLIAGLGRTFSPSDETEQPNLLHMDNDHSRQSNECFQCHRIMDPMRMVFQNKMNFTYRYNSRFTDLVSSFAFYNYIKPLGHLSDLGDAISEHPDFSKAWVQKLCVAFNSNKCLENDPEFLRVVNIFQNSNFNFKTLYKELLLSDLVTGLKATDTNTATEFAVSRARQTHLCYNLNARQRQIQEKRGITQVDFDYGRSICSGNVANAVNSLGDDHTVRGLTDVVNSFPVDTFSRQTIERTCVNLGAYFMANDTRLLSRAAASLDENIDLLTELFIGLPPSHPRHFQIKNSIRSVYDYSMTELAMNHTNAFREAFNFACSTPDLVGAGL
jgi:hypothetical protein